MTVLTTKTLTVTIDAPFAQVVGDLADPITHPEWADTFFAGPAVRRADGSVDVMVPMMGGPARMRVAADAEHGVVDIFLAPANSEDFGAPLPVRVIPNAGGVDVLWTLTRFPGVPDEQWEAGLASMERELANLRQRLQHGTRD